MKKKQSKTQKADDVGERGGRRENSGRPSLFRGKSASSLDPMYGDVPSKLSLRLTRRGLTLLDAAVKRCKISRNDFMEGLIRVYGRTVTREEIEHEASR
jgi:hypothetical protein